MAVPLLPTKWRCDLKRNIPVVLRNTLKNESLPKSNSILTTETYVNVSVGLIWELSVTD